MEKIIGLRALRENTGAYVRAVQRGASFVVMRHSQPLFRMTPLHDDDWETVIDFTRIKRGGVDIKELLSRL